MSNDASVTKDLLETLEDGKDGFAKAAEKLADDSPQVAGEMRRFSAQRADFAADLKRLAAQYGDDIDESGSVAAAIHRGWISLKDALSGSDPSAVLKAAIQGEDHAVSEYEKARDDDISPSLKAEVLRQLAEITVAREHLKTLTSN